MAGEKVAKSWEVLQKHKIKAIINCAGDYCENWFEDKQVTYLTYFLKDSQNENIECLFYRSIDFIEQHLKNKQNVLVHCIQGISRSVTIVIAYIIFKLGSDYKKAEQFLKQKRGIACPNNGFMVELIQFHKRLYEPYDALPSPRVFLVSAHSKETPNIITARLVTQPSLSSNTLSLIRRSMWDWTAEESMWFRPRMQSTCGSEANAKRADSKNIGPLRRTTLKNCKNTRRLPIKPKASARALKARIFYNFGASQKPLPSSKTQNTTTSSARESPRGLGG